jgi:3-oxoacyl-[acyl-carrier protein] reductase
VDVLVCQGDVSQDADCRSMVSQTMDKWGRLDVLVNNAATTRPIPQPDMEALDAEEFHRTYATNVTGPYQMSRAAAPHLKQAGDAAIVNISSIGGWRAGGSSMAYCASKGALNTLTISLARVLAPEIRVNAICPGGLLGNWTRKILSEAGYQKRVEEAETRYPLRRPVMPEDVATTAMWLIEGAVCMTGELIRVDSGQHLL